VAGLRLGSGNIGSVAGQSSSCHLKKLCDSLTARQEMFSFYAIAEVYPY